MNLTMTHYQTLAASIPTRLDLPEDVRVATCVATANGVRITLCNDTQKTLSSFEYVARGTDRTVAETTLGTMVALTQLVLTDPLLCAGVRRHGVSVDKDGNVTKAFVNFRGHRVDLLSPRFFVDGQFQGHRVIHEIIHKVETASSGRPVCHISFMPIDGAIAFLPQETTPAGDKRLYAEENIRKWVLERGTAPFTREHVSVDNIKVEGIAAVPLAQQPRLPMGKRVLDTEMKVEASPAAKRAEPPPPSTIRLTIVVDRSGSMRNMAALAQEGVQQMLRTHATSGVRTLMTLSSFDNTLERHMQDVEASTLTLPLTAEKMDDIMAPRGGTALYDAIFETASDLLQSVEVTEKGILAVITDGYDTGSQKGVGEVHALLERMQREKNIECIFMAANIGDATDMGATMGFSRDSSLTFASNTAATAFSCMNQSMLRSVTGGQVAFTRVERQSSAPSTYDTPPRKMRTNTAL
tara:strand:- start:680 stop:2080 length:1401 start_codon:yes stop_codon:yes gene_type:complete